MDSLSFDLYYTKALLFLSRRPRSEKEVRDNLMKKKADPDVIEGIIKLLKKQKFLNDVDFAKWWVRQRIDFKPRSYSFIRNELKIKGVSDIIIQEIFEQSDDATLSEKEMANSLVKKKITRYKNEERNVVYQKVGHYLARRGFSWDVIKRAIDDNLK